VHVTSHQGGITRGLNLKKLAHIMKNRSFKSHRHTKETNAGFEHSQRRTHILKPCDWGCLGTPEALCAAHLVLTLGMPSHCRYTTNRETRTFGHPCTYLPYGVIRELKGAHYSGIKLVSQ
jgi:hypothetical protein